METLQLRTDPVKREKLHHSIHKWGEFHLHEFYPKLPEAPLQQMQILLANVLEFAETECGIVADLTGSVPRRIGKPSKRANQVHEELLPIVSGTGLEGDPTADRLKKGPDVDVKLRPSNNEDITYKPLIGPNVQDNFEFILFSFAEQMAMDQANNRDAIISGNNGDGKEFIVWPIDDKYSFKVTKGSVPDMVNQQNKRYYCTVEVLENVHLVNGEPKGNALAEFHMGYDPSDVGEDFTDTRSGGSVGEIMKMRIRMRGRDGKLLSYIDHINQIKTRVGQPDVAETYGASLRHETIANYLERTLRELRAEGLLLDPVYECLEEMLRAGANTGLWRNRAVLRETLDREYYFFSRQLAGRDGAIMDSKLKSDYIVTGETDPWWFIMSMANSGLLYPIPFFRGRPADGITPLDVAVYHEWLTSDALITAYIPDPYGKDPRNKVPIPPFMRTMSDNVMGEREKFLRGWDSANGGIKPTSGLMLLDCAIENQPSLPRGSRLTEDVFLKYLLYYFNLQKGSSKTYYKRPDIRLHYNNEDIKFKNYSDFFDFIIMQIGESLPAVNSFPDYFDFRSKRTQEKFRFAIEKLKDNINRHQATFNISTLSLNEEPELLEKFFKSGLLTRIGGNRAIFTSPRIVTSIWEAEDRGDLKENAWQHLAGLLRKRYDQYVAEGNPILHQINDRQSRRGLSRTRYFERAAVEMLGDEDFPSAAAVFYYEPPDEVINRYL